MTESIFVHTPKGLFNLGDAGRHLITLVAKIKRSENRFGPHVDATIERATVTVSAGREATQYLDVTGIITSVPEQAAAWKRLLADEYARVFMRTQDGGPDAA